jgi:CHAD domain-containing protein
MKKAGNFVWNERISIAANARRELPALMTAYFGQVRQILTTDPPPAGLHAIRLLSKKARYTLELFRPCYGPGLTVRLASMKRLQTVLGEVNDAVASERLTGEIAPESPARRRVEHFLRHRAGAKAAELRTEWTEVFDAPGQEQWWVEYLKKNAKVGKRA